MATSQSRGWRTPAIIGTLGVVGLTSVVMKVLGRKDYDLSDALLDLAYEALPAALLFVLIDLAIGRYEERQEARLQALRALQGSEDRPEDLLEKLADGSDIQVGDIAKGRLSHTRLVERTLHDGSLDRGDLDGSIFRTCILRDLTVHSASARVVVFESCTIDSVQFSASELTGSLFSDCKLTGATTFADAIVEDVRFTKCRFTPQIAATITGRGTFFISCRGLGSDNIRRLASEGASILPDCD